MGEVVSLHTQKLQEPATSVYLDLLGKAVRTARLSKVFPERRRFDATLRALDAKVHHGLYDGIYTDSRAGLPNMASFTRVLADKSVGLEALHRLDDQASLDARRDQAEIFDRMSRKRRYYEWLAGNELAPVDEHRVLLRRHEPAQSRASFRVELTKLAGTGEYLHVLIELTQTAGLWSHHLIDLDERGEVAEGTEALRSMVYRFATFDAETLFVRLHELEGVHVERVQRGMMSTVLYALPTEAGLVRLAEPPDTPLTRLWHQWLASNKVHNPTLIAGFASDVAAGDVRDEKSNDPLSPLLRSHLLEQEQARYKILRERYPFRVYKDRKFVASADAVPLVRQVCDQGGTSNIIYPLR